MIGNVSLFGLELQAFLPQNTTYAALAARSDEMGSAATDARTNTHVLARPGSFLSHGRAEERRIEPVNKRSSLTCK